MQTELSRAVLVAYKMGLAAATFIVVGMFTALAISADSTASSADKENTPIADIDSLMRTSWQENEIAPSPPATDGEWCRRVFLDVVGRIPRLDELDAYLEDNSRDKKALLVDRLLSDRYAQSYTRHWTNIWTNVLIGRSGGSERNSRTNRRGMQVYLEEALRENRPYDQMVGELIGAVGTSRPPPEAESVSDFNGAVNFLAMKLGNNPNDAEYGAQATAKTSQIFLGLRVQCTQCHDHPFNRWKQNQFWEFNAFFRQTVALRRFEGGRNVAFVELTDQDFQGPTKEPEEAEIFYDRRNGVRVAAYPVFTDRDGSQTQLSRSGFLEDVDRRAKLASLIRQSGYLPVALVNRYWAHFFGHGFTQPFDDMGPHNPPSHPELLEYISQQTVAANYDLKQLIRWITLSAAYGRSSRFGPQNQLDDPALGEPPLFSRFYPRQMRAEELYDSLLIATRADKTAQTVAEQERQRDEWLQQFVIAFGTDENDEANTFNGTIPQVLALFNGELIERSMRTDTWSFLKEVVDDNEITTREKLDRLFLAALGRKATAEERRWANQAFAQSENATAALQDVWWSLLNTNEFILNH